VSVEHKITSKETYRDLRHEFGDWFRKAGAKRAKTTAPGWGFQAGDFWASVWFPVDKYGWSEFTGTNFIIDVQVTHGLDDAPNFTGLPHERLGDYFSEHAVMEYCRIYNDLVSKLAPPPSGHPERRLLELSDLMDRFFGRISPNERHHYRDWAFRVYFANDLARWCVFLRTHLPEAFSRFWADALQKHPEIGKWEWPGFPGARDFHGSGKPVGRNHDRRHS